MANEITAGPGNARANTYPLLMLFTIPIPAVWFETSMQVVPTPSDGLPDWALNVLTQPELDALNAGNSLFYIHTMHDEGLSNAQLQTRAQAKYADLQVTVLDDYDNRYKFAGRRIDKV